VIVIKLIQEIDVMEYKIESSNVKIRKFLESLMPSFIEQLGLTNSKRAVLVKVTKDLDKDFQGATMNIEVADCMIVLIKPPKRLTPMSLMDMSGTLAHEMVHVKQLAKGQMKLLPNEARMWKGKRYSKKTKYLDMPWEIDAFSKQELLLRRALEL
jgi:hypothetical protein